jgi:hypothetical protein
MFLAMDRVSKFVYVEFYEQAAKPAVSSSMPTLTQPALSAMS